MKKQYVKKSQVAPNEPICNESTRSEKRARKPTRFQKEILAYLATGGKLPLEVSGCYYKNRLLRVETEDALRATGLVKQIAVQGKRRVQQYLVISEEGFQQNV